MITIDSKKYYSADEVDALLAKANKSIDECQALIKKLSASTESNAKQLDSDIAKINKQVDLNAKAIDEKAKVFESKIETINKQVDSNRRVIVENYENKNIEQDKKLDQLSQLFSRVAEVEKTIESLAPELKKDVLKFVFSKLSKIGGNDGE